MLCLCALGKFKVLFCSQPSRKFPPNASVPFSLRGVGHEGILHSKVLHLKVHAQNLFFIIFSLNFTHMYFEKFSTRETSNIAKKVIHFSGRMVIKILTLIFFTINLYYLSVACRLVNFKCYRFHM